MTRYSTKYRVGLGVGGLGVIAKNLFDTELEHARELEGERQAGVVFADLERVDRLAADAQVRREVGLRPAVLSPEFAEPVFNGSAAAPAPARRYTSGR